MMHPSTSVLTLIDAPAHEYCDTAPTLKNLKMLDDAAAILRVPIFAVRYPDTPDIGLIATAYPNWSTYRHIAFDPATVKWQDTELAQAIAKTGRTQLIVSGLWLEEAITLLALKSLAIGLDTFVPVDATAAINEVDAKPAHARLTQAGCVPTTSGQILREWAALSGDAATQSRIGLLLHQNSANSP
ncbi:MAG: isochorismatase family protein [Hyphomicrobiaceae bacterium]